MTTYRYRAVDASGAVVEDSVEAGSLDAASALLENKGLTPLAMAEERGDRRQDGRGGTPARLPRREVAIFSRQFGTLLRSGVNVSLALETLMRQCREDYRPIFNGIYTNVGKGGSLSESLALFPATFNRLYVATVGAAEKVGALANAFRQLSEMLQWELKIRRDVRGALQYPATVVAVMILAVVVLQQVVLPQFGQMFARMGGDLPLPTRLLMAGSEFFGSYWWALLGAAGLGVYAFVRACGRPSFRLRVDRALLDVPVVGMLLHHTYLARFARTFSLLQANGLPLLTSLGVIGDTIGNREIARQVAQVRDEVERGSSLAEAVGKRDVFTPLVKNMVRVGEQSGTLDESLIAVCDFYDGEIQSSVATLTKWIEPALTVFLGAFVLFLALAIFLPWWDLASLYH
ncbi:MAG: type II secretion system F family protein [Planctomycetes bacterium]|nr:type II secretion system F family protein [Planctomycetota bacterium]